MRLPDFYRNDIAWLEANGRRRSLALPAGRDFSSNDYLALAGSADLRAAAMAALDRGVPLGSGGSRLLRGHGREHEALETEAVQFFGAESALFLGSGYGANSLVFSTLPQPDDLILHDALIHASAHEGMRLARCRHRAFRHNDVEDASDRIADWRREGGRGTVWIAFETLYSMDGDRAPVDDFADLAARDNAMLLIDEAHAVGALGPRGRGLASGLHGQDNAVILATCGKALGCEGALVLAPAILRDFLINRGRGFIFSTAPSPLVAAVVRAALTLVERADDRRENLCDLVDLSAVTVAKLGIAPSGSHIQPIVIGDEARTMAMAAELQRRGFDIRGIRPPAVPQGTARLRLSITLNAEASAIAELGEALEDLL